MAKVTVALSRKVSDGAYGSFQATIGIEDEVPKGTSRDSHAASLRAWCKSFLDETLGDLRKEYLAVSAAIEEGHEAKGAEEVGAEVEIVSADKDGWTGKVVEEKPPLPIDPALDDAGEIASAAATKAEMAPKPSPSDNDYRKTFRIQSFEVAQTAQGDKYLKCYGKAPWKRAWVPAWNEEAQLLFGDIDDMDLGVVGPPYDLDAVVQMKDDEWKGKKYIAPDKVIEWQRIDG